MKLRAGLIFLAALQMLVGSWTLFFPSSFYNDVPTVDWTPPYSEHLFRDFGSTTLGIGIVLIAAAIWLERRLVLVALLAYLAYSVPHLAFHAHHLEGDSPTLSTLLLAFTILWVLIPLALLPAALSRPRTGH
ncbi:hypothetical protein [Kribbella catacumbae]|uniref:hypothetical protein n=1 Tax=Kribbella catacumbae TaxID=460086 RepID=UPI00037CC367|nr:hypothetical protein [Kribbella catacumbae]